MIEQFVCEWHSLHDPDGGSVCFDFSYHDSLDEAKDVMTVGNSETYFKLKHHDTDTWEPYFVHQILVYEDNLLAGTWVMDGANEFRYYPKLEHWDEYYPELVLFPPQVFNSEYA